MADDTDDLKTSDLSKIISQLKEVKRLADEGRDELEGVNLSKLISQLKAADALGTKFSELPKTWQKEVEAAANKIRNIDIPALSELRQNGLISKEQEIEAIEAFRKLSVATKAHNDVTKKLAEERQKEADALAADDREGWAKIDDKIKKLIHSQSVYNASIKSSSEILKGIGVGLESLTPEMHEQSMHASAIASNILNLSKSASEAENKMGSVSDRARGLSSSLGSANSHVRGLFPLLGKFYDLAVKIGPVFGGILLTIEEMVRRFVNLEQAAGKFREDTGLISTQMSHIALAAREVNVELAKVGVTLEIAYKAATELTKTFQVSYLVTKDIIRETAMLATNIGIAAEDTAQFLGLFGKLASDSGTTASNIMHAAIGLANLAGVAPSAVMKDMATASKETLVFLGRSPMQMMRTAVEARRLGTTLKSLSDSARGLLNYQESMTNELEASALINRNISFQRARQLAWEGKIVESRAEALRQIEQIGDFTKLNVFQQEALAKASGMTVDEIIKQQNQQRLLAELKRNGSLEDQDLLRQYEDMNEAIKERRKEEENNLIKQGRLLAQQALRQNQIEQITNTIKGAWINVTDALIPIVMEFLPTVKEMSENIGATLKKMIPIFKVIGQIGSVVFSFILGVVDAVLIQINKITNLFPGLSTNGEKFAKVMKDITRYAYTFGVFVGDTLMLIGSFVNVAGAVWKVVGATKSLLSVFSELAVAGGLLKELIGKIGWISKIGGFGWVQKLTSGLGVAFGWISGITSGIGGFFTKITTGTGTIAKIFGFFKGVMPFFGQLKSLVSMVGIFAKVGLLIGRWATPFGWIITAIQFIYSIFKRFTAASDEWAEAGFWGKMWIGIKAISGSLFDVLVSPFLALWNWCKKYIFGQSPSMMGELIVNGIVSVGSMLFDALISPFKRAWNYIKDLPIIKNIFGTVKDVSTDISDRVKAAVELATTSVVEIKNLTDLKETIQKLTDAVVKLGGAAGQASTVVMPTTNDNKPLLDKIDELVSLLKAGGIVVNLDGRKVSSTMSSGGR